MENTLPTISVLLLLAIFHNLTLLGISLPGQGIVDPHDLGAVHGAAIREGQWWRLITALTLHADSAHLFGNLAIGGMVITSRYVANSARDWRGTCCSEPAFWAIWPTRGRNRRSNRSLGASTAIFGAVGNFLGHQHAPAAPPPFASLAGAGRRRFSPIGTPGFGRQADRPGGRICSVFCLDLCSAW